MTYEEALSYIHSFQPFVSSPKLDRLKPLLDRLGNPQDKLKFIHVAGTNGKGSTVSMCTKILTLAGYRCGMYTSPYVLDFCERFQINGTLISHRELIQLVEEVKPILEDLKLQGHHVNEFDVVTTLAFLYFSQQQCDIVCLEVGLGGRHDSTNIISTPLLEIITSISFDHTHILGDTIEQIAYEKAGIIKPHSDCICYPKQHPDAIAVLLEECANTSSRFLLANPNEIVIKRCDLNGSEFIYDANAYTLSFVGEHQIFNAVCVIQAMHLLRQKGYCISEQAIMQGLKETTFSARFQKLREHPTVIVDGAHNPEGAQGLAKNLTRISQCKVLIVGMMKDKDYTDSLRILCEQADHVICVPIENPRAISPKMLAEKATAFCSSIFVCEKLEQAYKMALELVNKDDFIIVCGSFYLAGEMIPIINKENSKTIIF